MFIVNLILSFLLGVILGIIFMPVIIYLRARKSGWDNSNIFNVYRVVCHLALHPKDFTKMRYEDGKDPFWYVTKDEFSEIVKTRPNKNNKNEES